MVRECVSFSLRMSAADLYGERARIRGLYTKVPETGHYPALRTYDGELYVDTEPQGRTHVMFAKFLGLDPTDIRSGGWVTDGVYDESHRTDLDKWAEQAKAKKIVEERRRKLKTKQSSEGDIVTRGKDQGVDPLVKERSKGSKEVTVGVQKFAEANIPSTALANNLKRLYDEDQRIRKEYQKYLNKFGYPESAREWIKDKHVPENDLFGDRQRANAAQRLIRDHANEIFEDDQLRSIAWLLVQHMDNDVAFQKWFLSKLPKDSQEYKYLYDRVAINRGGRQKYDTQVAKYGAKTQKAMQESKSGLRPKQSSGGIPAALRGLAAEARKCGSFEEFERDFLREIKHGTYWHWTDDPNFEIDPSKGPKDMSSLSTGKTDTGKLMVTSHLDAWSDYGPGGKGRPYAALIDMSDVPRGAYKQVRRGFGNEFYVSDPSKARVEAVYPRGRAFQVDKERAAALPQSSEELEEFYDKVAGR